MEKKSEVMSRVSRKEPWDPLEMKAMVMGEENGNSCTMYCLELPQVLIK